MALDYNAAFPAQTDAPDADYPQGKARNISAPGLTDGTPWDQDIINDLWGFLSAIMVNAGLTANGNVDTAQASQYFSALSQLIASGSGAGTQNGALASTGSAGAYAITLPDPIVAYANGVSVRFRANHSRTGAAASVNIDGVGPAALVNPDGTAAVYINAGGVYDIAYSSALSKFVLLAGFSTLDGSARVTAASDSARGTIEIATPAEAAALSSTTLALTPGRLGDALDANRRTATFAGPITATSVFELVHGLGPAVSPWLQATAVIECQSPELGYLAGDFVNVDATLGNTGGGTIEENGVQVYVNNFAAGAVVGSNGIKIYRRDGGNEGKLAPITAANWNLILRVEQ